MALILDPSSAEIEWKTAGAAAAVHLGSELALLHCTKNVILGAANVPGMKASNGPAIEIEGRVFLETTAGEFDIGNFGFGMVQVSTLFAYDVLYVGRVPSEGSTTVNLKQAYTDNPSLDVEPGAHETIADHVFSPDNLTVDRLHLPRRDRRRGFNIKVSFGDNPWSPFWLQFQNSKTGAPNYIAKVARNEAFITHFVVREPGAPTTILARLGWTVNWYAEFNWVAGRPVLSTHTCLLFPGVPRIGAVPSDPIANLALAMTGKTTNQLDNEANDAWAQRREPTCMQLQERPSGFRSNFYQ